MVIASAPGRVNLIGDHTDYAGGVVLPMAIQQRTAVALSVHTDRSCVIESLAIDACAECEPPTAFEARPQEAPDAWVNLAIGPLRLLSEQRGPVLAAPAFHAVIASDVPIGAGVSSSAALSTAMTTAMLRCIGATLERWALIDLLRDAEQRFTGTPCGIMDMTVAVAAEPHMAMCIDCGNRTIEHVPIPDALIMFLVDSGVRHALSDGGYAARRSELAAADHDPRFASRARHVRSENARVHQAVAALRAGDLSRLGARAFESHDSLRDDYEVSVAAVDRIVERVRTHGAPCGAFGARMTGGGFGGSVIVFANRAQCVDAEAFLRVGVDAGIGVAVREVRTGARYTAALTKEHP